MSVDNRFDSSFLMSYKEYFDDIFRMYIEDINPYIVQIEAKSNYFPVEVLNEIRAIYGHLTRAAMANNENDIKQNIIKMKSHSKRALLDCMKYIGVIYHDEYIDFMKRYENIDLTYIDNGSFLNNAITLYNESVELWQNAKKAETSNISEIELYDKYQDAYEHYEKLHTLLKDNEENAIFLQHKANKKESIAKKSYYIGIGGFLIGIVGVLIAIFDKFN